MKSQDYASDISAMADCDLQDAEATAALGARLASALEEQSPSVEAEGPFIIHLHGDLGAGKTTLARGLMRALGVDGPVRSPTYTLVEPYATRIGRALHMDLYRIADPEELAFLGLDDADATLWLVEWPERGAGGMPYADLHITLTQHGSGRRARLEASGVRGKHLLPQTG